MGLSSTDEVVDSAVIAGLGAAAVDSGWWLLGLWSGHQLIALAGWALVQLLDWREWTGQGKIESFGGKVNKQFSKTTTHLLAPKKADASKARDVNKWSVVVVDLQRLQKILLLGQFTFSKMSQLNELTRDSFKISEYEPATTSLREAREDQPI